MGSPEIPSREYFRRDQSTGISPPNLAKDCTFAEHIVHARGKRTKYTSVSLDLSKIRDFGDTNYRLNRDLVTEDGHALVEHEELIQELRRVATVESEEFRLRALQALRYATRRKEGLVSWSFNTSAVARNNLINWAQTHVQQYFSRV